MSTKETCIYTNTRFSMSENTHREDISCFEKQSESYQEKLQQEISKQDSTDTTLRLYDLKVVLQKFLHSHVGNNEDCMLHSSYKETLKELMKNEIQETNEIQLEDSYKERLDKSTLTQLSIFLNTLNQTGIFLIPENKHAILQNYTKDFLNNEEHRKELTTNGKIALLSAVWFWNHTKLYKLADTHNDNNIDSKVREITKKVNGGYNDLHGRQKTFKRIRFGSSNTANISNGIFRDF